MTWLARYFPERTLSSADRAALRAGQDERFRARYVKVAPGGIACAALTTTACATAMPARWATWGSVAGAVLVVVLAAVAFLRERLTVRALVYANQALGLVVAYAIGETAEHSSGVMSVAMLGLLLLWLYATVVSAMRTSHLAVGMALQATLYVVPSIFAGNLDGLGLFFTLALGAAGIFAFAAMSREAVETRMFATQLQLTATNARLEQRRERLRAVADDLAHRVNAQLANVLDRRREVEQLERAVESASRPISIERATPTERLLPSDRLPGGYVLGDRAKIVRPLASGGFADVYVALDLETGRDVVAKVMRCDPSTSAQQKKRFLLEAAAANSVPHPAIVRVLHVDMAEGGQPYLLSERVEGVTLRWCLEADALGVPHYLGIVLAIADALAAVHAAGIVHRDLKPDNVMLQGAEPGIKLLDFGVSRGADSEEHHLTAAGELLGTGAYMAPEQIVDGGVVSAATDLYALGLTMFECLAGEHPLAGLTLPRMIQAHVKGAIPSLRSRAPLLDGRLSDLVEAMLRLDPSARPSLDQVMSCLRQRAPSDATATAAFQSLDLDFTPAVAEGDDDRATLDGPAGRERRSASA